MSRSVRKGAECPYLDTISRQVGGCGPAAAAAALLRITASAVQSSLPMPLPSPPHLLQNLDFDFEKCCSVTLAGHNVYACLVCGKYFQGRGPNTQAYTHALEAGHHMFMQVRVVGGWAEGGWSVAGRGWVGWPIAQRRAASCVTRAHARLPSAQVDSGRVYCLPDMYEVQDRSLADIQYVLNPTFTGAAPCVYCGLLRQGRRQQRYPWARAGPGPRGCGGRSDGPLAACLHPLLPSPFHARPPEQPRMCPSWTAASAGRARWTAASICRGWWG